MNIIRLAFIIFWLIILLKGVNKIPDVSLKRFKFLYLLVVLISFFEITSLLIETGWCD